uniref:Transmembrane protein n=1 Tax=Caenorhabditis japonica TaxID=281687 RepID=A0A8R1IDB6_CAEJA
MEDPKLENPRVVKMSSKPTGTANWKIKLYEVLRYPMRRTGPAIVASAVLYIAAYNIGVRWWKGADHPVNRFTWRIQEQNGTLDATLRAKKEAVLAYQEDRFYRPRDVVPDLGVA